MRVYKFSAGHAGKSGTARKSDVTRQSQFEAVLGELRGLLNSQIRTGFVEQVILQLRCTRQQGL